MVLQRAPAGLALSWAYSTTAWALRAPVRSALLEGSGALRGITSTGGGRDGRQFQGWKSGADAGAGAGAAQRRLNLGNRRMLCRWQDMADEAVVPTTSHAA